MTGKSAVVAREVGCGGVSRTSALTLSTVALVHDARDGCDRKESISIAKSMTKATYVRSKGPFEVGYFERQRCCCRQRVIQQSDRKVIKSVQDTSKVRAQYRQKFSERSTIIPKSATATYLKTPVAPCLVGSEVCSTQSISWCI